MRIGLVVEGLKDVPVFEELIPKIRPGVSRVIVRPSRGRSRFMGLFPKLLWTLRDAGEFVAKAIAVRDANAKDAGEIEAAMRKAIDGRGYPFRHGVELHATKRETETWLLADIDAINRIAVSRGGNRVVGVPGPLEDLPDAKEQFERLLFNAGLPYDAEVVRLITREIDLQVVRFECPGFRLFERKVLVP